MRSVSISLGWSLAVALVAGAVAVTPVAAPAQSAGAGPVVQLSTGRGRLVTLTRPMSDVFVADDKIADVQVRSPTQLYIFGKAAGETTISVTNKAGTVVYGTTVRVGNNFDSIQQMLGLAMPDARIVATPMNGLVLLTGTVKAPEDGAEATRLVQAFVGDSVKVISRLGSATPLQVNLQVRIAEVSRSFAKTIGSNLQTRDTTGGFKFGVASGRSVGTITPTSTAGLPQVDASAQFGLPAGTLSLPYDPATRSFVYPNSGTTSTFTNLAGATRTALGFAGKAFGLDILGALDLGERDGQVSTLANPNITVISGETSSFLAGGEIPIPVSQGLGAVSVEYKPYGVSLAYTPTVLADGRISIRVRPEVSQLSAQGSVTIGGTTIPALTTRRVETTVELGSGQSMMIGGLLSNDHNNTIDKTPGIGDVPIVGALFRSNSFQRNETELVVVITPYLVKPVNANDIVLPTDGYKAPTDLGRVFLGQLSDGKTGSDRPKPSIAPASEPQPTFGTATPAPLAPAPSAPAPGPAPAPAPQRREERSALPVPAMPKQSAAAPGFSFN